MMTEEINTPATPPRPAAPKSQPNIGRTLERLYNTREGLRKRDDLLPERLLKEPLPDGPNNGSVVALEELKNDAYAAFGWDLSSGVPKKELLKKLGIGT